MSKYVVAFRGQPSRTTSAEGEQAWGAWFGQLGPAITDRGNRVGATRTLTAEHPGDPRTAVLSGYFVIEADDLDAAAGLAAGCPGLADGVDVEVAEVVPS
ncbi:YciI family protein [Sinomonas albida]|uniref:YciI family protein n=1 Tax=Sinomonas albida TaxID=369942 RepID=UPI0010A8EDC5|nr:YciI family protein [Sinomonas albida]